VELREEVKTNHVNHQVLGIWIGVGGMTWDEQDFEPLQAGEATKLCYRYIDDRPLTGVCAKNSFTVKGCTFDIVWCKNVLQPVVLRLWLATVFLMRHRNITGWAEAESTIDNLT